MKLFKNYEKAKEAYDKSPSHNLNEMLDKKPKISNFGELKVQDESLAKQVKRVADYLRDIKNIMKNEQKSR